jgi:hypothetical protein
VKDWRTATGDGLCAYDVSHRWKTGDRVYALAISGVQRVKLYCPACAIARHGAPPDPGESAVELQPKAVRDPWVPVGTLAEGFDAKRVAAEGRER